MNDFPAKILLLGEYSILTGSMGIAVPYPPFSGSLQFPSPTHDHDDEEISRQSNRRLRFLLEYLNSDPEKTNCLDVSQFKIDISDGLYFRSNIPQGYGVGSSGALTAAIFDRYAAPECKKYALPVVRKMLAGIEQLFHGTSSGLDPMVSYTKAPVVIGEDHTIETLNINPGELLSNLGAFLIDTGSTSSTAGLVSWFRDRLQDPDYHQHFNHNYLPVVNRCTGAVRAFNKQEFFDALFHISAFQLEFFTPMIPASFRNLLSESLSSGSHLLKLCGSGGGGYLLGFSRNPSLTAEWALERNLSCLFL